MPYSHRIYLSSIGYAHGQPRPLADLSREISADLSAFENEIATYRMSDQATWELATAAAEHSLATAARPDILVYVSQNDSDSAGSLARIADRLSLRTCGLLALSGHDCGNFGPALRVAGAMIRSGECTRVLLILADRAHSAEQRLMASGLSVFSDGAAACLITRDPEDSPGPHFRVDAIDHQTRVRPVDGREPPPEQAILDTVALAKDSVHAVHHTTGLQVDDIPYLVFPNYRTASQRFLAAAMGFSGEKLLLGAVSTLAHCFSADIAVTLHEQHAAGTLSSGSHLLAAVCGPHSWSTMALKTL